MNGIDIMDIMAAAGHVAIAIGAIAAAIVAGWWLV